MSHSLVTVDFLDKRYTACCICFRHELKYGRIYEEYSLSNHPKCDDDITGVLNGQFVEAVKKARQPAKARLIYRRESL